jgi:hypothetical protein
LDESMLDEFKKQIMISQTKNPAGDELVTLS